MGVSTLETPETGLVRAGARSLITTQQALEQQLQVWQSQHVHALCPVIDFGALPEQYALVPAKVQIDPNPQMGEVYFNSQFCKPGEVALSAIGLQKLAHCAGISLYTKRTDPRNIPNYWEYQAVARWTGLDGAPIERSATKEWDLRDGSDQLKGFTPKQISEARKHGGRNAETRAINAAIRQLGIKQKYTTEELKKPFGLVRVVYQPDMRDPVQRAIVAQSALGASAAFAHPAALPAGNVIEGELAHDDREPARPDTATNASSHTQTSGAAARATTPEPDFDPVPDVTRKPASETPKRYAITSVQKVGDGGHYYVLTAETGTQRLHTEDAQLARDLFALKGKGPIVELQLQVEADAETKEEATWIVGWRNVAAAAAAVPPIDTAAAAPALPEGACFVEKIDQKSGTNQRTGKAWKLFTVTFSTGEQGKTFSETIAKEAEAARAGRLPVTVTLHDNPQYPDSQDLVALAIVDTRQRSFLESEL